MRRTERYGIIAFAVIVAILIVYAGRLFFVEYENEKEAAKTVRENVGVLEALEAQDVEAVSQEVDAAWGNTGSFNFYFETHTADEIDASEYEDIFEGCVVMGDSITHGLESYEFLRDDQVVAKEGLTMAKAVSEGYLDEVAALQPEVIFLSFGLNDLLNYSGDVNKFQSRLCTFIEEVKAACPNSRIYINSMMPVISPMTDKYEYLKDIPLYNMLIWYDCTVYSVTYVDNSNVATEDMYASDGTHFKKSMYKYWLYNMAKTAYLR